MRNLAVFVSGGGTNAENLIRHFNVGGRRARVSCVYSDKPRCGALDRARSLDCPVCVFRTDDLYDGSLLGQLLVARVDLIVLAGFLRRVPADVIAAFPRRIVNIHPALLPRHGGRGMYGHHVHEAVLADGDKESGITIHYVNEELDRGDIIFQARCPVEPGDTPDTLAARVHVIEMDNYPRVVEQVLATL